MDRLDAPNLVGAQFCGKVLRIMPGTKTIYVDCGNNLTGFLTQSADLALGDFVIVEVTGPAREEKALPLKRISLPVLKEKVGLLTPPPTPWQRAHQDLRDRPWSSIRFNQRDDYNASDLTWPFFCVTP
jgi:hypothetical protein